MATPLSAIMVDAKDLADMVNSPIVADPTWRRWINQAQERLYRMLVVKAPARFYATSAFVLTGLGGNTAALPAGFRRLLSSGITKDPTVPSLRHTLRRFEFGERDAQGQLPAWGAGRELAFDIQGGNVVVEPAVLSAGNYSMYYVAGPTDFATDGSGDSVNIATVFEPYVDYVAHWAAVKGLMKEESTDTAAALRVDLAALAEEILTEFNESSDPSTIIDQAQVGGIFWP